MEDRNPGEYADRSSVGNPDMDLWQGSIVHRKLECQVEKQRLKSKVGAREGTAGRALREQWGESGRDGKCQ